MSQNNTIWKYNDVELKLDLAEADDARRFDECFRALDANEKSFNRDLPNYQIILNYCKLYSNLFDSLFGEGTYERLSAGKTQNINVAHDIYDDFLCFAKAQSDSILDMKNRFTGKYSPNRAQRRAAKRG